MKTLIRNFSHTFRRFFTASVLNIVGLAIAFASFFVIITQVDYDYNFNKGYKDYEKIFRVEVHVNDEYGWQVWLARPFCELVQSTSPHITSLSILTSYSSSFDYEVNGKLFNEKTLTGFGNFMETFQPEMINGTADALKQPGNILIPQTMAIRFFGTTDVVGQTIFQGKRADNNPVTVGGVYKDFPENSQIRNTIFKALAPNENKDNWSNWNYHCYIRIDNPEEAGNIEKATVQKLMEFFPDLMDENNVDS